MRLSWIVVVGAACGSSSGDSAGVQAVAHVVKGPTSPTGNFAPRVAAAAPADGDWVLSPSKLQATITAIAFQGATGTPSTNMAPLTGCTVSFDATTAAMAPLLDCAFDLPAGTYIGMNLFLDSSYQVTIADATNGFYTDGTGLTTTMPAGGAVPTTVMPTFGNNFQQVFSTPLVVSDSSAPAVYIVVDAVQTVAATVSGGTPMIGQQRTSGLVVLPPVFVFPTIDAPGQAKYFTQSQSAGSVKINVATNSAQLRTYAGADMQPVYAYIADTSQAIGGCFGNVSTFGAYATDPSMSPMFTDGSKIGGWLARDAAGDDCWALPADSMYATYASYVKMHDVSTLGATTTFSCQSTATPVSPTSGSTYAAGCPAITATGTTTLALVAD